MELTNFYSLELFIKICIGCNLWSSKFSPLKDEIYPRLRTAGLGTQSFFELLKKLKTLNIKVSMVI